MPPYPCARLVLICGLFPPALPSPSPGVQLPQQRVGGIGSGCLLAPPVSYGLSRVTLFCGTPPHITPEEVLQAWEYACGEICCRSRRSLEDWRWASPNSAPDASALPAVSQSACAVSCAGPIGAPRDRGVWCATTLAELTLSSGSLRVPQTPS